MVFVKGQAMLRAILTTLRAWLSGRHNSAKAQTAQPTRGLTPCVGNGSLALGERKEGRCAMNAAYEKLIQHLEEHNIGFWARGEDQSICADFRGAVGTYRILARVDADDSLFQVFGQSPVRVPQGSRVAIAETVARANCGLKIGKFEMDVDEGDLRFQVSQVLSDDDLDGATIRRLMGTTMAMLDIYLPAVLSVIYGNELPKDAIRHVEPVRQSVD
jgi:hypothetical protein